jgi:hypothetical protein
MSTDRRAQLRHTFEAVRDQSSVWQEPPLATFAAALHAWAMQRCVFSDRSFGGIVVFHKDYVEWCREEGLDVPCSLAHFRAWLLAEGFVVSDFALVYGLLLTPDAIY